MTPAPLTEPIAAKDAPASNATQALKVALKVLDKKTLLDVLLNVVDNNPIVQHVLEKQMLVLGSEVVRYHIDSDSEDNKEESEEETVQKEHKISREKRPIAIKDDEFTGRFAVCLNCEGQFNVTKNFKGNCIWHPGKKEFNDDDDFWADHDENCHGQYRDLIDEPDYAGGFSWSCCDRPGDDDGCKSTRHRTKANEVVCDEADNAAPNNKRKAEEEIPNSRVGGRRGK